MSLPPGFLDELRSRVSLAAVAGRKLVWDARKSNPAKGDYWAPCPFHQEKTPSFHLDDRKGFYYCFGCHAKGDALTFVRETENVSFMEAVEILAREAGMTMPARDPRAQEKADLRSQLVEVMEQAAQFYRLHLNMAEGARARAYLQDRALSDDMIARFEIGFAPDSRTALFQHLTGKGVAPDLVVQAGLAIKPDDGSRPYDRFRGRIMFPIRDSRGRCIAFGGRALDANARAKYLNSPETPLFDKGRSLFNFVPAREAAGKTGRLIVAEGYMDVIALSQAGFRDVVAPLGTAITADQLRLMWRIAPEPIIALDGDKAGLNAAMRLIDVALPLLAPNRTLRFCLLPEGLDPDDMLRAQGPGAMQKLLDTARPLVDLLWQRETTGRVFDSPERRAALDASLKSALGRISDPIVRNHYAAALREKRRALFAPAHDRRPPGNRPAGGRRSKAFPPQQPADSTRASLLARAASLPQTEERLRESVILSLCLAYPAIVADFDTALEKLHFAAHEHDRIRDLLLDHAPEHRNDPQMLQKKISAELGAQTLEKLLSLRHVRINPAIRKRVDIETARMALAEELAKLEANRGSAQEVSDAMQDIAGLVDEGLTWRLGQAAEARDRASRSSLPEGGTEAEDRENLSRYLQNLIDSQVWVKKKH